MHGLALLQRCAQRPVQAVLQIELTTPGDDMGEQIAIKGGVLFQQRLEIEGALGRDQLVQSHLVGCDGGPLFLDIPMVGVWAGIANSLEDHVATVGQKPVAQLAARLRFGSEMPGTVEYANLDP